MDDQSPPTPATAVDWVRDVALLAAVPAALLGVYTLPGETREALVFVYTEPTLLTAYTAHFVHLDLVHLASNLLAYLLLVPLAYLLAVRSGRRQLFVRAFITFLIGFPVVISALNLAFPRNGMTFGFSAINMALVGLYPLLLVAYANHTATPRAKLAHSAPVFFASLAAIALLAVPLSPLSLTIAGLALAITGLYAWNLSTTRRPLIRREDLLGLAASPLLVTAACLYLLFLVMAFPAAVTPNGEIINLYGHFIGYSLAFMVAYVSWTLGITDPTPTRLPMPPIRDHQ